MYPVVWLRICRLAEEEKDAEIANEEVPLHFVHDKPFAAVFGICGEFGS